MTHSVLLNSITKHVYLTVKIIPMIINLPFPCLQPLIMLLAMIQMWYNSKKPWVVLTDCRPVTLWDKDASWDKGQKGNLWRRETVDESTNVFAAEDPKLVTKRDESEPKGSFPLMIGPFDVRAKLTGSSGRRCRRKRPRPGENPERFPRFYVKIPTNHRVKRSNQPI